MKARMFCPFGELAGQEFLIEREAIIGRASGNEIVLSSLVVSAKHARLYYSDQDEAFWIEDLGSRNGTRIDGRPLVRPRKLGSLHVVTLADGLDFVVHCRRQHRKTRCADRSATTPAGIRSSEPASVRTPRQQS